MSDQNPQQPPLLLSIELRILGALMEKQLTTPDQYPLTLNTLITACNQKSSRDPVSNHTQGEIARALQQLQHKKFVNKEYGSRAEKFSQYFIKHLELGKKHQALLCVMMLRGAQTLSELNTRTQRMVEFSDKEDLEHTLDRLCNREIPYVSRLSQQPGQRGERFTHLFSGTPEHSVPSDIPESDNDDVNQNTVREPSTDTHSSADTPTEQDSTNAEIAALRLELDVLAEELQTTRQQLTRLYQLTGYEPD